LRFKTSEQAISYWFNNTLVPILNNPCKSPHPVV
jgi:hypothetical protein